MLLLFEDSQKLTCFPTSPPPAIYNRLNVNVIHAVSRLVTYSLYPRTVHKHFQVSFSVFSKPQMVISFCFLKQHKITSTKKLVCEITDFLLTKKHPVRLLQSGHKCFKCVPLKGNQQNPMFHYFHHLSQDKSRPLYFRQSLNF